MSMGPVMVDIQGLELEPDDLLRGGIINELMCNFSLDISALEQRWNICFVRHFRQELEALAPMANDGLLSLDDSWVYVTPAGRLLIRNICMVFDRYLRKPDTAGKFSKVI